MRVGRVGGAAIGAAALLLLIGVWGGGAGSSGRDASVDAAVDLARDLAHDVAPDVGQDSGCTPPAAPSSPLTADVAMPAGANYSIASFRLWYPANVSRVRALLVLVPGSNTDGRGDITSASWQQFANDESVALLGSYWHDYTIVADEQYAQASLGSGQAMLDAIDSLAAQTGRCDLSGAPLLLWGFSAGGEYTYDFTAWAPQKVIAFVVNKGGYYHPSTPTAGMESVPSLLFVGGQDSQFRIDAIETAYTSGRGSGAPWALTIERTVAHVVGDSQALSIPFFHALLPLRLPSSGSTLRAIDQSSGYIGNLSTHALTAASSTPPSNISQTAWLPDSATANLWQTVVNK